MADALVDGRGSGNYAGIDSASRLMTTGSITSMPAITIGSVHTTVDSIYIQSGDNINITSLPAQMGSVGVTALPGDLGSVVISSSNLIGVSGNIFTGGKIVGSFAPKGIGSVVIKSAPLFGVSGAIFDSGDITGSMVISSAPRLGVSGGIFIDGKMTGSMALKGIGSVVIKSAPLIGVSGAIFDSGDITGSMVISQSTKLGISGIVEVSNTVQTAGSIYSMPEIVIGSVSAIVDSVYIQSGDNLAVTSMPTVTVQSTNLDIRDLSSASDSVSVIGSVRISAPPLGISGTIFTGGKIVGSFHPAGIGSVVIASSNRVGISGIVDVASMPSVTVTATDLDIRSLTSASDSVEITGTTEIGSVVISSAPLIGVSGGIFIDGKMTGSMAMKGIGSVIIHNSNRIGVSGIVEVSSMPTTTVQATNFDIRDLTFASDKVTTSGTATVAGSVYAIGSVVISSSSKLGISGPVWVMNPVGISGVNDIGSVVIKSAPLIGVSGLIFTDGKMTGSMAMKGIGSMIISSSSRIGVSGIVEVNEVIPTDVTKQNPSYALVYDPADSISGIYFQTSTGSYFQSFLWDAGSNIIHISEWSII